MSKKILLLFYDYLQKNKKRVYENNKEKHLKFEIKIIIVI